TLELVAAAISSIINCPVKTYDECVADGLDVLPNQILDLDLVHKYSFIRQEDEEFVQNPPFRQGGEKDERVERVEKAKKVEKVGKVEKVEKVDHRRSRQGGEKYEKVIHRRSGDEKVVNRRSFVRQDDDKVQVNPDSKILPPQPIQIFVKTSFGRSHSMFAAPNS